MTRNGGSMADPGPVSYLFNRKGVVIVPKGEPGEDDVLQPSWTRAPRRSTTSARPSRVLSEATDPVAVRTALQDAGIDYESADRQPGSEPCRSSWTRRAPGRSSRLIDALEDSDDVQNVFANFDVSDEVMEKVDA